MTYLAELSPCWYLDHEDEKFGLVSVGWLSREHTFARGPVPLEFRERLAALMDKAYSIVDFLGSHLCEFCAPVHAHPHDLSYPHGCTNLIVPGLGVIYACPELIIHYIDAHGYQPPDAFVTAVLQCPPISSEMYFRRLLEINDAGWRSVLEDEANTVAWRDDPSRPQSERDYAEERRAEARNMQRALRRWSLRGLLHRWFTGSRRRRPE